MHSSKRPRITESISESPTLRRSKRKKLNATPTEPNRPSHLMHRLGEDHTFCAPEDVRPVILPQCVKSDGPSVFPETAALLKPYKDICTEASQKILYSLAPLSRNNPGTYAQLEWLTTSEAFSPTVCDHLQSLKLKSINLGRPEQAERIEELTTLLSNSEEAQRYIFSYALNHLQVVASRSKLEHVEFILSTASKRPAELKNIRNAGIRSGALKRGADGKENFTALEGRGFQRIWAPYEGQTKRATAVFIWEKADPEDLNPTPENIVGAIVYSPQLISKAFSPSSEYNEVELRVTQDLLVEKDNIDRPRLIDDRKMAKGIGPQSGHGIPYFTKIPDNPKYYRGNINIPIQSQEPYLLARHESFLSGLLPEFAARRKAAAREANLINRLGFPSLSTFATYGYSASAHFDHDACPSSGWVTSRSGLIDRYTSNFVWASHGVVAELAPNAFWFWRGKEDAHGTTVHLDCLQNRGDLYTKGYIKKNTDSAQWTRASVLTKAVSGAHKRRTVPS